MKRLIFSFILLIAAGIILPTGAWCFYTRETYRGPGDRVPGAIAYYGLRGYNAKYARPGINPAIEIRRASDNATQDIAILRNGALDIASANSFCMGTVCYVVKWYDQSGHHNDISQHHDTQQPWLVLNGGGIAPVVQFSFDGMTYLSGNFPWVSGNQAWSGQVALLNVSPTNWYEPIFDYGTTTTNESLFALVHLPSDYSFSVSIYGSDESSGIASTAPESLTFYSTGTDVGGYANGVNWSAPFADSAITGTAFNLGGSPAQSGIWLTGGLGEVILYQSVLTAKQAGFLAADERKYFRFSGPPAVTIARTSRAMPALGTSSRRA